MNHSTRRSPLYRSRNFAEANDCAASEGSVMIERRKIVRQIAQFLKQEQDLPAGWLRNVPRMAQQLESFLFQHAKSLESYKNMSTLHDRLYLILAAKMPEEPVNEFGERYSQNRTDNFSNATTTATSMTRAVSRSSGCDLHGLGTVQRHETSSTAVNNHSLGYMANVSVFRGNTPVVCQTVSNNDDLARQFQPQNFEAVISDQLESSSQGAADSQSDENDNRKKMRIQYQQQRLLLLHHAAKCPYEDGCCVASLNCGDMKRVWKHLGGCKDKKCETPYCFSSRTILSHHLKCKDRLCLVCAPVRAVTRPQSHRQTDNQLELPRAQQPAVGNNQTEANNEQMTTGVLHASERENARSPFHATNEHNQDCDQTIPIAHAVPLDLTQSSMPLPVIIVPREQVSSSSSAVTHNMPVCQRTYSLLA